VVRISLSHQWKRGKTHKHTLAREGQKEQKPTCWESWNRGTDSIKQKAQCDLFRIAPNGRQLLTLGS